MKFKSRAFRLALAALLLALMLVPLSGCHGSVEKNEFTLPDSFDESRVIEISFWAKNDTNILQTEIYKKAIADFEALYPSIKVNLRLYTDYGKIYNDVITNMQTDTSPNVCISYPDHIATYLSGSNTVVPLDGLFDDERFGLGGSQLRFTAPRREELVEKFLGECAFRGSYYALPFMRSTEACYVNRSFVEKLGYSLDEPLTWDFVWEVSEAAMEKDAEGNFKLNGQKVMIPFIYKSTDNMMIQQLRQLNADYSNERGEVLLFNDVTKSLLEEIAAHVKTGAFSTFKISSYPANFLNAGQCIFAIDSTAGATWMGSDAPLSDISEDKFVRFETELMAIPQFDTAKPQMLSQGPSLCIFNKSDAQEVLASWLFTQYLLSDDVQIAYAKTEGYAPVTLSAQQSAEYQDYLSRAGEDNGEHYDIKIKATQLLMDNVENSFVTPVFNGSASVRDAAGQLIENVAKSVRRRETVDEEYFEKLFSDVQALYRLQAIEGEQGTGELLSDLGPLPTTARLLLGGLAAVWLAIIGYVLVTFKKKKRD